MLFLAPLLLTPSTLMPRDIADIDGMAQRRDVAGLTALLAPLPQGMRNPFNVLQTGGAYAVGSKGWHAADLESAAGHESFVVVWTPLTSEDIGEIVLKRTGDKLTYIPEADPLGAKIERHKFDLRFDIPHKQAFLVDKMTLRYAPDAPSAILFRMSPCYEVRSIQDSKGQPVPFHETAGVISMKRGSGSREEVTVKYDAVVNLPDYAASISEREATLVNDYWYPMIARWPAPYEVTIHAPKGWVSVAQGERLFDRAEGDQQVTAYKMDLPITYFSLISAPFKVVERKIEGRTYTTWSSRLSEEKMVAQDELYGTIFNYYSSIFGPPPYPQYGCVDSRTYGGGALEAYTFATWGGGGEPSEDAHEPSHTWWGGIVDNTYLKSFWNESFADFSDGLYHRNVPIGNTDERRLAFVSDASADSSYNDAAMSDSGADIGPVGSSLGYGKGAKVLQMLEQWIGTDHMIAAMHEWATSQPKGEPGNWEDFERVVTRLNRQLNIQGFFDDWVRRPGYADFSANATLSPGLVQLDLNWKGPKYRMPVTVMLQYSDGRREYDTTFLDETPTSTNTVVRRPTRVYVHTLDRICIQVHVKPVLVSIDPWRQSLRQISSNERPTEIGAVLGGMRRVVDPKHDDWLENMGRSRDSATALTDPAGLFIVGSPETLPLMRPLCEKAGFKVHGDQLTYNGTTIDLNHGAALAVVDLDNGKHCVIGLGKTRVRPDPGRSRLVLTDDLGRFLRGVTEPKTKGNLTFRP